MGKQTADLIRDNLRARRDRLVQLHGANWEAGTWQGVIGRRREDERAQFGVRPREGRVECDILFSASSTGHRKAH